MYSRQQYGHRNGLYSHSKKKILYLTCVPGRGIAQLSRQDIFKADSGVGIEMTDRVFRLAPCHALPSGIGMLQNLPSAVVAHVLKLPPGATVLDMCAAPGGGFLLFACHHRRVNHQPLSNLYRAN